MRGARFARRAVRRAARGLMAGAIAGWLAGCGAGDGLGLVAPEDRRTEWLVDSAPTGLTEAVVLDSARWDPAALLSTGDPEVPEVEGPYRLHVRNAGARAMRARFDLRFYDGGDAFVDNFIHSGQWLLLPPGAARTVEGRFFIRTDTRVGRFGLRTLRIAAQLDTLPP